MLYRRVPGLLSIAALILIFSTAILPSCATGAAVPATGEADIVAVSDAAPVDETASAVEEGSLPVPQITAAPDFYITITQSDGSERPLEGVNLLPAVSRNFTLNLYSPAVLDARISTFFEIRDGEPVDYGGGTEVNAAAGPAAGSFSGASAASSEVSASEFTTFDQTAGRAAERVLNLRETTPFTPGQSAAIDVNSLKESVLYVLLRSDDVGYSIRGLLSFSSYSGPEQLAEADAGGALEGLPAWMPVGGIEKYDFQIVAVGSAADILARGSVDSSSLDRGLLSEILGISAEYRYRVRAAARDDTAVSAASAASTAGNEGWTDWRDFFWYAGRPVMDPRVQVISSLLPGIPEPLLPAGTATANSDIPQDERFPGASPISLNPQRLPSFMRYELTNTQAALLFNKGLREGELIAGEDDFGDPVLISATDGKAVVGFSNLYYGIQMGLALNHADGESGGTGAAAESGGSSVGASGGVSVSVRAGYADHPAAGITWFGALYLANRMSRDAGLEPVYDLSTLTWDRDARGYRLPTEMEWEAYARLQSFPAPVNYYRSADPWEDVNYPYNREAGPTEPENAYADSYRNNPDQPRHLLGNVWEWCWDWYDDTAYSRFSDMIDPSLSAYESELSDTDKAVLLAPPSEDIDPNDPVFLRSVRGTAWNTVKDLVRITNRGRFYVDETSWSVGLRLVLD